MVFIPKKRMEKNGWESLWSLHINTFPGELPAGLNTGGEQKGEMRRTLDRMGKGVKKKQKRIGLSGQRETLYFESINPDIERLMIIFYDCSLPSHTAIISSVCLFNHHMQKAGTPPCLYLYSPHSYVQPLRRLHAVDSDNAKMLPLTPIIHQHWTHKCLSWPLPWEGFSTQQKITLGCSLYNKCFYLFFFIYSVIHDL